MLRCCYDSEAYPEHNMVVFRCSCCRSPDKNHGNADAQQQFVRIAEAYESLVDLHAVARTEEDTSLVAQARTAGTACPVAVRPVG